MYYLLFSNGKRGWCEELGWSLLFGEHPWAIQGNQQTESIEGAFFEPWLIHHECHVSNKESEEQESAFGDGDEVQWYFQEGSDSFGDCKIGATNAPLHPLLWGEAAWLPDYNRLNFFSGFLLVIFCLWSNVNVCIILGLY
jgi:hypothetical protein